MTMTVQHEAVRNHLLRRVDWRFLLPTPAPFRSVCFAGGELADAVRLVSTHLDAPDAALPASCDLAVAIDPDAETLEKAWKVLRPGGACYIEWQQRAGRKQARRRLKAAGFDAVAWYWPWPPPSKASTRCWLPLDAAGIRRFVQHTPTVTFIPGRWGVRTPVLYGHRLHMGLRYARPTPLCVVARKPATGKTPSSAMPHALHDLLKEQWTGAEGSAAPDSFSWLLLTGGARTISKVVGLVFAGSEATPKLVVKLPRVPEAVPALQREADILQAVHAAHPHGAPGVPRVVFCKEQDGHLSLGETVVAGVPLWVRLRRRTYRKLALQVTDWLADFAGRAEPRPRAVWGDRLVEATLRTFAAQFAPVLDPKALHRAEEELARLDTLPLVCEQRDLGPWNVVIASDGTLGVLDWESAELYGLPALDLIYFLTFQAFFHNGAMRSKQFRASYRALLDPSTFTGRIQAECMARYGERMGLHPASIHPLRLLCWMIHARSDYRHFAADEAGPPGPDVLRHSVFLSLWEEELIHGNTVR